MPDDSTLEERVASLTTEQKLQKQALEGLIVAVGKVSTNVDHLTSIYTGRNALNWQMIGVIVSAVAAIVAVGWFTVTQNVQLTMAPQSGINARVAENQIAHDQQLGKIFEGVNDLKHMAIDSSNADAVSRIDRGQLNERLRAVEASQTINLAERKAETARLNAEVLVLENEVSAQERIRCTTDMHQQQMNALLWNKAHASEPFPIVNYCAETRQSFYQK